MGVVLLLVLVLGAFAWQVHVDRSQLAQLASAKGWRLERITFAPFAPGWLMRSKVQRAYRLHYRDGQGRIETRTCVIGGAAGFRLDPPRTGAQRGRGSPLPLPARLALGAGLGLLAGPALGIAVCFAIYPGSNVAPAYGVIFGAPLGLLAGVLVALWSRD
jgi:hypothetical protein